MALRKFRMTFFGRRFACRERQRAWPKSVSGIFILLMSMGSYAAQNHDLFALETNVAQYLDSHYQQSDAVKVDITVNGLDRRLQLAKCDTPLEMKVSDPTFNGGSQTVHTRCTGSTPWSIYVPAQIVLFRSMTVASRSLERGELVTAADLTTEVVNTSALRQGQLADPVNILGKEVKRPIQKGEPFRAAALEAPLVIKRGDPVIIELQAGIISVNTSGVALANGRVGDRIRVRNGQSERIVSAQVIAAGKVATAI
jgi:flagella basal body P-ring formation protein FlgA